MGQAAGQDAVAGTLASCPFATPETPAELEALRAGGAGLRVAYLSHSWNRKGERRIQETLSRIARGRSVGVATLFFVD